MATPKFIVDMKAQPRSMKHGDRKTAKASHGNPVDGTSPEDDRADASVYTFLPGGITPDPTIASRLKQMQDAIMQVMVYGSVVFKEPKPPSISHAGIRAGEIIGYRLWWVDKDGRLRSLIQDNIRWQPGEPMVGDVDKCIYPRWSSHHPDLYSGVYAFKDLCRAREEFQEITQAIEHDLGHKPLNSCGLALGSVKLWGEVVEHEYGYRASFAKPNSFDEIYYWTKPEREPKEVYLGPGSEIDSGSWTG
jgi:hypothetical protein